MKNQLTATTPLLRYGLGTALLLSTLWACNPNPGPHPGEQAIAISAEERAESNPEIRLRQELEMLRNPATGQIPKNIRALELAEANRMPLKGEIMPMAANAYVFQGPANIGGRTRAIAYDVRYNGTSNRVILAGGVSGGMFRSADGGLTWARVSSLNNIHSVTCVAQDPRPGFQDTWYYGTGEGIGNSASADGAFYFGFGIYKSTDNGLTWNQLASTTNGSITAFDNRYDLVTRIAVDPTNGEVYAAAFNTINRSSNGGTSWTGELGAFAGNTAGVTDVLVTSTGIVYAAIPGNGGAAAEHQGIWKKQNGTWTRIAQGGSPSWFNSGNSLGRIVLAAAPSNQNLIYVLYDNGVSSNCTTPAKEAELGLYDNASQTWTDLSANLPDEPGCSEGNDPFAVQGGYDLALAVKPDNPNVVLLGGVNAFRSTDGFTSTANTIRIAGYSNASGYGFFQASHPDIHCFTFAPNNPNIFLMGTDGGISEADISVTPVSFTERNTNFNTLQYYYADIDPTTGSQRYLGGTQDNGSVYRNANSNNHLGVLQGDGCSVGISAGNSVHYVSTQQGSVFRRNSNLAAGFINARLTPANLSSSRLFVTLFHLDPDNTTTLYYADHNKLYRNGRADTVTLDAVAADRMQEVTGVATTLGNEGLRSFATNRGAYNSASSVLYFGTNAGKIFRLSDPRNCPTGTLPEQINAGAGMPAGATVIGLAVNPRNADTVVAVFSNYSVTSIWFCGNALSGSPTWTAIEGNLQTPSIRSATIVVAGAQVEYYVGTSTGLYSTIALNGNSTTWLKEGADVIGNAVVSDIAYRPTDNRLLIATHGNGLFTTDVVLPVRLGSFAGKIVQDKAELFWHTYQEVNNKGFDVERSDDGLRFRSVGFVPATTQVSARNNYRFTDPGKLQAVQYYRLKQVDKDGSFEYSTIIKLSKLKAAGSLKSVVNPLAGNLIYTWDELPAEGYEIRLIDAGGRLVYQQKMAAGSATTQQLNIAHLPNGSYRVQWMGKGLAETRQVIKRQ
ncbi:MAG: T9SS type A sorting domain-containing protein [Chitinophagaceae bacterium]|nr:T9SS type A sorting domain-containing protein [Chitinophagaceae bacterium]